ncbi:MAG TPA: polyphosphate kinase 2 family protein [Candidatus Xenobia bacterium]
MKDRLRVKPGTKVKLKDWNPDDDGGIGKDSPEAEAALRKDLHRLSDLQERLYAECRQSLLVVLQGMDTAGKDGTISHVMRGMNPSSVQIVPFKQPTSDDVAHDFLWRIHKQTPAKGRIAVFNRSHYEDVLVARVHKLVPDKVWSKRYKLINHFEQLLVENGTRVIKFFLYISKDEQKARLQSRIDDKEKHWKLSEADFKERALWDDYIDAYEQAMSECSTDHAPWYVVPANHKWYRNLVVARILADTLEDMNPGFPLPTVDADHLAVKL